jgi:hypothetical protein
VIGRWYGSGLKGGGRSSVSSADETEVYRFVVAFRREPREIPGASTHWRGWVMRVDPTGGSDELPRRIWFTRLEQLPDLVRRLIAEARGLSSSPADDGTP